MMNIGSLKLDNEKITKKIGEKLYKICKMGDFFAVHGSLGAGKTTLIRYFINKGLNKTTYIPSPSYNLYFTYKTKKSEIFHFDAWRLNDQEEFLNLGLLEVYSRSILLVEWANKIKGFLPKNRLDINIFFNRENRILSFKGNAEWKKRLSGLL